MGKKAKKRWRTVPIELCSFKPVGRKDNNETEPIKDKFTPPPPAPKFNEDEYTKISTPRQDVLFKKGYLGRRRVQNVGPETPVQEHHSQDSMKSDYYVNDSIDPAHMILPPPAYIDPVYFLNGSGYEVYDPYTGSVTVVVGPPAPPFPPGGHPYLTPIPYQHVPMQPPLEWFSPQAPPQQWAQPSSYNYRKRFSFDSQNCSAQSSESTGPPSSPQETELIDDSGMASQYQYSGYMYPPYHINDVTGQTQFVDAACHPETSFKRRKQLRKRRRREGIADGGSESSCEDHCYQSGASVELTNDSKTASDSGVNTHNSGGSTPVNSLPPYPSSELVSGFDKLGSPSPHPDDPETPAQDPAPAPETQAPSPPPAPPSADVCATHPHVPVEDVTSSISTAQSVDTPPSGGATSEGATLAVLDAVNDNKENCDVNICSKQEASSVSCNSKILSKANLSVVESNSIRACESAPPADDQTSNPKAEKGSNKQSKAKSAQAPSPKNSKKSKSKSKSKTQQAPGSKQSKNNHSEEPEVENASAETNERTSTPTSKTSKKLKKGQERKSKESITPEKQVVDVNKESESKQDKEKSPRPDCELNGKDTDVKSEVEGTGAEKNVIEAISEFHPSESQCCLSEVSVVDNAEPKTEIELCVDVAGFENEVSTSEKAPDVPDKRVEVGGCEEGAMEPKAPNAAPTDEQRFLATFVNLEEIGETIDGEEVGISRFSSCRDVEPKRPPRRKKSEKRLAENVASQVLDEVLAEAAEKVSEVQNTPPGKITEAVSKWLTENGGVLPPLPQSQDDDWEEEDEELEEESIATDQKNSESNPFPASLPERDGSPEGGGKRVATPKIGAESDDETVTTIDEKSKLLELGDDSGCSLRNRSGEKPPGEAAPDQTDTSNHENKTDLKVHHSSSFPCGICCNIL